MGTNSVAAQLDEVLPAAQQAWQHASDLVTWDGTPDAAALMRLDLVRDFTAPRGVAAPHLAGLSRIAAQRAKTTAHHASDGPGVETVYRKTMRWQTRAYLRDAIPSFEAPRLASAETVRFELQMRSRALRENGIATLQDLTAPDLTMLTWRHFQRSRFNVPVGDPEAKLRRVMDETTELSASDRRGLLGQLQLDAIGWACPAKDKTVQKYRRLAAQSGLTPADVLQGVIADHCPLRHLDYEKGSLRTLSPAA
ncbi:hypothetical protein V6K52_01860 [Knoellia sp. S7-12]|uniref:hypothetical protein n=1 Tax=Knoellia sp. S7-12 TaxID=3126698 RepID=UPI0033672624